MLAPTPQSKSYCWCIFVTIRFFTRFSLRNKLLDELATIRERCTDAIHFFFILMQINTAHYLFTLFILSPSHFPASPQLRQLQRHQRGVEGLLPPGALLAPQGHRALISARLHPLRLLPRRLPQAGPAGRSLNGTSSYHCRISLSWRDHFFLELLVIFFSFIVSYNMVSQYDFNTVFVGV